MDPTMLIGLLQMGMGGAQSATNTALGAVPMLVSMWDRVRARTDPLMRQLGGVIADRYNQSVTENPYGDAYGAWGGIFGSHDDGTPIGAGEAQARAIVGMMGDNPAASTIANYQQLSQMQRPQVQNTAGNLQSLMGHQAAPSGYVQPQLQLQAPGTDSMTRTNFEGAPAPRDTSSQTIDPKLASGGPLARLQGVIGGLPAVSADGGGNGAMGGAMANILPLLIQANQNYSGGYGTGGLLRSAFGRGPVGSGQNANAYADFWAGQGRPAAGGGRQFDVGTPYVKQDMNAKIHQGEAILPANANPWNPNAKAAGAWNNVPQNGGVSGGMNNQGGGVSGGVSGGPVAPAAPQPPNLMQQVLNNPVALNDQVQQSIVTRGTDALQNEYASMLRNSLYNNAGMGGVGGMVPEAQMQQWLAGQGAGLKRDVGISAAQTNWQNMLQSAGLQLQGEQAATQANQWQQQFEQNLYGQDIQQWANMINAMNAAGQQGQQTQMNNWNQLLGLTQGGINQSTPFLSALLNLAQWRISPNGVQAGPMQTSGPPVPFMAGGGYGSGGYGGGGGGSSQNWGALSNALGQWAGMGFPGMS